jgi:hypothetical protein
MNSDFVIGLRQLMRFRVGQSDVISPLTPALSPLRGEGEYFAGDWRCFTILAGSWEQGAN